VLRSEGLEPENLQRLITTLDWSKFTPYSFPSKYVVNLHKVGPGSDTRMLVPKVLSWVSANPKDGEA
jgi:phosphomevalonate kinase